MTVKEFTEGAGKFLNDSERARKFGDQDIAVLNLLGATIIMAAGEICDRLDKLIALGERGDG